MTEQLPANLLLALLRSSPEQMAAVCRIFDLPVENGDADSPAMPDEVARQAFALVKNLDAGSVRKASAVSVFQAYCVECLSAEKTAKKLRCSKGTVINRLRLIEERTGASPDKLRAHSVQFERMEDELSDSRAHHIRRAAAADLEE